MGTERIFGGWDDNPGSTWHNLAAHQGAPNFGLSQRRHEIEMLWSLYLRASPKVVVEVGVAQGGTAASWMVLGRNDATFIFIDRDLNDSRPRPGDPTPYYSGPLKYYVHGGGIKHIAKPTQSIIGINGWTYEPKVQKQLLEALAGRKIDWLFHDASHEETMFLKDFEWMWPLVAEGGVMAVHDIQPSAAKDVTKDRAWARIKATAAYSALFEFCGPSGSDSLGIGILVR